MNTSELITDGASSISGRRGFLRTLGFATAGTAAAVSLAPSRASAAPTATDVAVLNFALNLEYLEAEYYLRGTTGGGLDKAGYDPGAGAKKVIIKDKPKVTFATKAIREYAEEIAEDEARHVRFIREALQANGATPVSRPVIDLKNSFKALGGLIGVKNFDPFANEINFLLGAFIFEDVGVTAYKGASPLLTDKGILEAAAGILGVEAYHAGVVRTLLYQQGPAVRNLVKRISDVRQTLDNTSKDMDQGIVRGGTANLVPTDGNSVAFSRNTRQVLNIVYGKVNASKGLFFPDGLNGSIK